MKAMLYADWMNFRQSIRSILFVMVVFAATALVWNKLMFFNFIVVMLSIMIPTTLFAADQAYGWNRRAQHADERHIANARADYADPFIRQAAEILFQSCHNNASTAFFSMYSITDFIQFCKYRFDGNAFLGYTGYRDWCRRSRALRMRKVRAAQGKDNG